MFHVFVIFAFTIILYAVPIFVLLPIRWTWKKSLWLIAILTANLFLMQLVPAISGMLQLLITVSIYIAFIDSHRVRNICLFLLSYILNVVLNTIFTTLLWIIWKIDIAAIHSKILSDVLFSVFSIVCIYAASKFLVLLYKKIARRLHIDALPSQIWIFILINLLLTCALFAFNITEGDAIGYSPTVVTFNTIVFFVYFSATIVTVAHFIRTYQKDKDLQIRQESFEAMQKYTSQVEELYNNLRSFKHDYVNILTTMYGYIEDKDNEGLEKYFREHILPQAQQIAPKNAQISRLADLKMPELKSLVTAKLIYAQEMGVEVSIEVDSTIRTIEMNTIDLTRILGIFLDKAIEAALESSHPKVSFVCINDSEHVLFTISNHFKSKGLNVAELSKIGVSTKGTSRGVGLYNVSEILKKYTNVLLDTSINSDEFIQSLLISYSQSAN